MPAFFLYLRNITYYLMFATVATMVAPAGKYRKFVSLVMGFILLATMLAPLARFSGEIPVTQWFYGIIPQEMHSADWESSYIKWRNTYLQGAFEAQLQAQLKNRLSLSGFTMHTAEFDYSDDFSTLTYVNVSVSQNTTQARRVPFIRIEPVQIHTNEQTETCATATYVKNLISEFYNLPVSHIHVSVTKGVGY